MPQNPAGKSRALPAIFVGGLIAGSFDITYAFIFYGLRSGVTPIKVLQSVASGALGAASFSGGVKTAVVGAFFHYLIAILAATVYYLASRKLHFMISHAVISGILFGVCIYLFMNLVVLPLSRIPYKVSYPPVVLISGLLIHMLGIGLPIALTARKYSRK